MLTSIGIVWFIIPISALHLPSVEVEIVVEVFLVVIAAQVPIINGGIFALLSENTACLESESSSDVSLFLLRLASVISVMAIFSHMSA